MKLKLIAPKCGKGQATNLYPPYVLAVLAGLTPPRYRGRNRRSKYSRN